MGLAAQPVLCSLVCRFHTIVKPTIRKWTHHMLGTILESAITRLCNDF